MPFLGPGGLLLRRWVAYTVLVTGLAVTVAGALYVNQSTVNRDNLAFENAANEAQNQIETRLNTYIELLRAGAALFTASRDVTLEEFATFSRELKIAQRYPGIQGLGFAPVMTRDMLLAPPVSAFDPRRAGLEIWPAGDRATYTPILLLEPLDPRNRRALGYDMSTEPFRRTAMDAARDSGQPAASRRVTLVQEDTTDPQAGFLIYMPIYRRGQPTATVADRRAALEGFVYSPFRGDDLLTGTIGGSQQIGLKVFDGRSSEPDALLHLSPGPVIESPHDPLILTKMLTIAGREWTLVFEGHRHMAGSSPWLLPTVVLAGLALSMMLFGVIQAQILAWEATNRLASDLRASEENLRETGDRLRRLVVLEREARAEAQQADRAKDDFLATLSHELRTPLNAMLGWLSMLRTGKVRVERRSDALDVIERNARVQARLIEDLLDVSRIVAGKIRLESQALDFGPIVETTSEALRPTADGRGVRLRVQVPSRLPRIAGDVNRLQQIVLNLVSNAIKFTPSGGEVTVSVAADPMHLVLDVRDTGIGIAEDFLPHVFERFRQADSSTTRAHSGVGLGLAIVRHLVELHLGTIEVFSDGRDKGSRFVVRLPVPSGSFTHAA